jgi:hypothetical protein
MKSWQHPASMPQGGLADEPDKKVVTASWVSGWTTKLIARRRLSSQWRHRRNSCASKQTGGPSSTGRLKQIRQIHALDFLRRERRDQRKQNADNNNKNYIKKIALSTSTTMTIAVIVAKTSPATTRASFAASNGKESANASVGIDKKSKNKQQKQAQPPWHVERASRAQHSQHEQRKRVDRQRQGHRPQQNKASARDDNSKYHLGGFHTTKKRCGLWCVVSLSLSLSRKSSPTKHKTFGENSDNDLDWDDAFKDAILPILRLHLMKTSKTGFKLKKPVLSTT